MSEGKREASEKRETRATEEGLVSRPMSPSCFIRAKSAKNSACSWVRVGIKKINSGVLCDIMFHLETLYILNPKKTIM